MSEDDSKKEQSKGLFSAGIANTLRNTAKGVVREVFDVCFDPIKEKSSNAIQSKTEEITSKIIHNEREFLIELDQTAQGIIGAVFSQLDNISNLTMARILSFMTNISLMYVAFQLNESIQTAHMSLMRIAITFLLLTGLTGAFLRVFRFVFDWRDTLKEYQRWQFLTGVITGCVIFSSFVTSWVIQFL